MRRARREGEPEPISDIVGREFGRMSAGRPLTAALASAWRRAVGERVASRALPVRRRGGALHVRVATSAWLHELQMLAPAILARLRLEADCARIHTLRFEVGELPEVRSRAAEEGPRRPRLLLEDLPAEVRSALEAVDDEVLRDRMARTVAAALGTRGRGEGE